MYTYPEGVRDPHRQGLEGGRGAEDLLYHPRVRGVQGKSLV